MADQHCIEWMTFLEALSCLAEELKKIFNSFVSFGVRQVRMQRNWYQSSVMTSNLFILRDEKHLESSSFLLVEACRRGKHAHLAGYKRKQFLPFVKEDLTRRTWKRWMERGLASSAETAAFSIATSLPLMLTSSLPRPRRRQATASYSSARYCLSTMLKLWPEKHSSQNQSSANYESLSGLYWRAYLNNFHSRNCLSV